ncbi:fatty acyl-AMP ligase [Streptomyces sp. NPDC050625]|uniref:fatty acyl-AMP ligase n=1 Tax=Streptomyces sp. NPDC050625 TaxID=3154629 RepID=UPI00343AF050
MSRFVDTLVTTAQHTSRGIVTGEPHHPRRQTWGQVHAQARGVATALVTKGLRPGGAVAVLAAEPELVAPAVQGVWLAGGSVTMLHQPTPRTDLAEWGHGTLQVLEMISADVVLLDTSFAPVASTLADKGIRHQLLTEAVDTPQPYGTPIPVASGEQDTALLQLTSGTTAVPKAVRITHGNLLANITAIAERGQLDPDQDVMMSWLPLFHDMGMIAFLTVPMTLGLELVKITPADFLGSPLLWPTLLDKYRATITGAPSFAYALLRKQLARVRDSATFDLSSLRIALNGAEPIDEAVIRGFTEVGVRFGLQPECVLAAYGLAEATLAVSAAQTAGGLLVDVVDASRLDEDNLAVPAAAGSPTRQFSRLGAPLRGLEVRAASPDGTLLGARQVGELLVRGESVTPGYLTVDGPLTTQDEQGWLHTGDLGYLADGEVVICGRSKDVIIMAGRNIYPTDIERVVGSVEGVRAGNTAAVRLHAGTRREGFAIIAESPHAGDADAELQLAQEIISRTVDTVGVRPTTVQIVEAGSLPKTPSGKLRRAEAARHLSSSQPLPAKA